MKKIQLLFISLFLSLLFQQCTYVNGYKLNKTYDSIGSVPQADEGNIMLPFTYNQFIFVDVYINGQKYNFVLDSGSPINIMNSEILDQLNYPKKNKFKAYISGTTKKMQAYEIPQFYINNIELNNFEIYSMDYPNMYDYTGADGIIGYQFLKKFKNFKIDYIKEIITLNDNSDFNEDYTFKTFNYIKSIELEIIKDSIPLNYKSSGIGFTLDTGSPGGLGASQNLKAKYNLEDCRKIENNVILYNNCRFQFEDLNYKPLSIEKTYFYDNNYKISCQIGNGFLDQYIVLVDKENNLLKLKTQTESIEHFFDFGLELNHDSVQVSTIYKDSPFYEKGLRPGESITEVNGKAVNKDYHPVQIIKDLKESTFKNLEFIENGEERTIER